MSFKTFLDDLGEDILKIFTIGEKVAVAAEPLLSIAYPAIEPLFASTVAAISNAQALGIAAANQGGTDAQKLANVVAAITPTALQSLTALGVPAESVTPAVVTAWTNAVVALIQVIPSVKPVTGSGTQSAAIQQVATSGALTGVGVTQPATPAAFVPATAPTTEVAHESALGKIGHGIADVFTGKADVKV